MQRDSPYSIGKEADKFDHSKMPQKRPSSPLPGQAPKKTRDSELTPASLCEKAIQRAVANQIELMERLVFKDMECQKLKKKFDEIDRNCRRWHDFAIGLQSRVKRLALILHRQQDTIKSLQTKDVKTVSVAIQTENDIKPLIPQNKTGVITNNTQIKKESTVITNPNAAKTKQEYFSGNSEKKSSVPVFIDLTDEDSHKPVSSKISNIKANTNLPRTSFFGSNTINSKSQGTQGAVSGRPCYTGPGSNSALYVLNNSANKVTSVPNSSSILNPSTRYTNNQTAFNAQGINSTMKSSSKDAMSNAKKFPNVMQKNGVSLKSPSIATGLITPTKPYPALPSTPVTPRDIPKQALPPPPQPLLKIKKSADGIELSWNHSGTGVHAKMHSYELYVYQHNPNSSSVNRWKRIGNEGITAMPLPMACTLSQFSCGSIYYFAVRGKDIHGRYGHFSVPCCSSEVQS